VTPRPDQQSPDTAALSKPGVIDSSETSEHTNEQTRSGVGVGVGVGEIGVNGAAHILPTSFITSVTSITSLEAGYQGDGENSRPASRGPEPLSIVSAANLIVNAACKLVPHCVSLAPPSRLPRASLAPPSRLPRASVVPSTQNCLTVRV
jgi:hypothetical protein